MEPEEQIDSPSVDDTMRETLASIEKADQGDTDAGEPASSPGDSGGSDPASSPVSKVAAAPAAPAAAPEPWRNMPKSWKQEMRDYWQRQDPAVMQYVHQREEEALRGITTYKQVADQWGKVLAPYQQQIKQFNINPYEAVSNLVAVHTILRHGTAEQKAQCAQMLERDYGLSQYYRQPGQVAPPPGPDLAPFNNRLASLETQLQARALGDATAEVEKFISDPSNKYAAEAAPRMLELLEQGRASDLKEAYELSIKTDPVLFEKLISERIQAATKVPAKPPTNTRPSRVPPQTAGRSRGTIEDTMRETLSNINNR